MKYKVIAEVEGDVIVKPPQNLIASNDHFEYEIEVNPQGKVRFVSVSIRVPPEKVERFRTTISEGKGDSKLHIAIRGDPEIYESLIAQLRLLEALWGFNFIGAPLERIRWDAAETKVIPESPEEQALLQVVDITHDFGFPRHRGLLSEDSFARIVSTMKDYAPVLEVKSLWREGMNELKKRRFVQAFQSFYFILEELYANGKSGEKTTVPLFQASEALLTACGQFLESSRKDPQQLKMLESYYADTNCAIDDVAEMPRMLFRMRGKLLHFSRNRKHGAASIGDQRQYHALALAGMYITKLCIGRRVMDINATKRGD